MSGLETMRKELPTKPECGTHLHSGAVDQNKNRNIIRALGGYGRVGGCVMK